MKKDKRMDNASSIAAFLLANIETGIGEIREECDVKPDSIHYLFFSLLEQILNLFHMVKAEQIRDERPLKNACIALDQRVRDFLERLNDLSKEVDSTYENLEFISKMKSPDIVDQLEVMKRTLQNEEDDILERVNEYETEERRAYAAIQQLNQRLEDVEGDLFKVESALYGLNISLDKGRDSDVGLKRSKERAIALKSQEQAFRSSLDQEQKWLSELSEERKRLEAEERYPVSDTIKQVEHLMNIWSTKRKGGLRPAALLQAPKAITIPAVSFKEPAPQPVPVPIKAKPMDDRSGKQTRAKLDAHKFEKIAVALLGIIASPPFQARSRGIKKLLLAGKVAGLLLNAHRGQTDEHKKNVTEQDEGFEMVVMAASQRRKDATINLTRKEHFSLSSLGSELAKPWGDELGITDEIKMKLMDFIQKADDKYLKARLK